MKKLYANKVYKYNFPSPLSGYWCTITTTEALLLRSSEYNYVVVHAIVIDAGNTNWLDSGGTYTFLRSCINEAQDASYAETLDRLCNILGIEQ